MAMSLSVMWALDGFEVREGFNPKLKAVELKFSIALNKLPPGEYKCQVTVLNPTSRKASPEHSDFSAGEPGDSTRSSVELHRTIAGTPSAESRA